MVQKVFRQKFGNCYVVVSKPLEQESLHHLTFPQKDVTSQILFIKQLSLEYALAVQKLSRINRDRYRKRLYPLHKDHTTQVTASKACQDLWISCTVEIGQDSYLRTSGEQEGFAILTLWRE
ncbi:hypothetical protein TNCV_4428771 [Trichonephila clavipes]|nr:hypothetical protein TNCV_4428771 [Trichonephila clavipes]